MLLLLLMLFVLCCVVFVAEVFVSYLCNKEEGGDCHTSGWNHSLAIAACGGEL